MKKTPAPKKDRTHPVLTKQILTKLGWVTKKCVPEWMAVVDTYPTSDDQYDIFYKLNGCYLDLYSSGYITIDRGSSNYVLFRGKIESVDDFVMICHMLSLPITENHILSIWTRDSTSRLRRN